MPDAACGQFLETALSSSLSSVKPDVLEFALCMAREAGAAAALLERAELTLCARRKLSLSLVAMLERLSLDPLLLAQANILDVRSVAAADVTALQDVLGSAGAERLRVAAQKELAIEAGALAVPFAQLTVGARIGSGSHGVVYAVELKGLDGSAWTCGSCTLRHEGELSALAACSLCATPRLAPTAETKQLALKRVSLAGLSDAERYDVLRTMRRDFRSLLRLSHANIVRLCGAVTDEADSIGLLMECAPHGSLRMLLNNSPARVVGDVPVQLKLAAGIAAGMAHLHSEGVLHHDLKSDNVLLFDGLVPKLADFGLAVTVGGSTLSTMRAGAGTITHIAPEQLDEVFTQASEVYSFAIVLWEMQHGARPWAGKTPAQITRAVDRGQRPAVSVEDGVLRQLMTELWAHEADDRPSFADIDARLQAATRTFATSKFKKQ